MIMINYLGILGEKAGYDGEEGAEGAVLVMARIVRHQCKALALAINPGTGKTSKRHKKCPKYWKYAQNYILLNFFKNTLKFWIF